uniref:Uncharacterized protein n=1 Tax=Zea mays TaxID=4577 RepID=A0A804PEU4_MAIZE
VLARGRREALEPAGHVVLVVLLEVVVERVRDVAADVQHPARRLVAKAGAVRHGARVSHVVGELRVVEVHRRLQHAPLPLEVLHALGSHETAARVRRPQVQLVLGQAVVGEDAPVPLEVPWLDALVVLVDQAEQVGVDGSGPHRRAPPGGDVGHEALVEALRHLGVGVPVAVRRPPDLADDHGQVPEPVLLQRPYQRVVVRVEHVAVGEGAVHNRRRGPLEEGVVHGEVRVDVEAYERVDVDGEGTAVVAQELHYGEHQVVDVRAEVPVGRLGGRRGVDIGVERACHLDLVAQAGFYERALYVPDGGESGLQEASVVCLQERLIPDCNIPDITTQ